MLPVVSVVLALAGVLMAVGVVWAFARSRPRPQLPANPPASPPAPAEEEAESLPPQASSEANTGLPASGDAPPDVRSPPPLPLERKIDGPPIAARESAPPAPTRDREGATTDRPGVEERETLRPIESSTPVPEPPPERVQVPTVRPVAPSVAPVRSTRTAAVPTPPSRVVATPLASASPVARIDTPVVAVPARGLTPASTFPAKAAAPRAARPATPAAPERPRVRAIAGAAAPIPTPPPAAIPTSSKPAIAPAAPPPSAPAAADGDDPERKNARKLARLFVSEIKLYNEKLVAEGLAAGDLYGRLADPIQQAVSLFERRVPETVRAGFDYMHDEIVRQLARGDATKLGPGYSSAGAVSDQSAAVRRK